MALCRRWGHLSKKCVNRCVQRSLSTSTSEKFPNAVTLASQDYVSETHPSATPVVIMHGLLGQATNFRSICRNATLSGKRSVYALDLRNHGVSPHSFDISWEAFSADLAKFLHDRGIPKAHVVGHSLGGRVAMATALFFPEVVETLTVVDIAPVDYSSTFRGGKTAAKSNKHILQAMKNLDLEGLSKQKATRNDLNRALAKHPGMDDSFVRGFALQNCVQQDTNEGRRWIWRNGLEQLLQGYDHMMAWPFTEDNVPHESLFIEGGESPYMRGHSEAVRKFAPNSHLHTIPQAGHFVHSQKPKEFLEAVVPFVDDGWTQHVHPDTGQSFFHQRKTGKSEWELPQ